MQFNPLGLLDPCRLGGFAVPKRRQPAAILCRATPYQSEGSTRALGKNAVNTLASRRPESKYNKYGIRGDVKGSGADLFKLVS